MFGEWPEQKKSKLQGWELVHRFSEGIARFCKNMSKTAISSKKQAIAHFWWVTWAIRSCSLSTLIFVEWNKKTYIKHTKKTILGKLFWANRSWLLICHQRPDQFAHSCSFVLSNLSKSLTVAYLIWAKWANEWMSDEQMNEFPALRFSRYCWNMRQINWLCHKW